MHFSYLGVIVGQRNAGIGWYPLQRVYRLSYKKNITIEFRSSVSVCLQRNEIFCCSMAHPVGVVSRWSGGRDRSARVYTPRTDCRESCTDSEFTTSIILYKTNVRGT